MRLHFIIFLVIACTVSCQQSPNPHQQFHSPKVFTESLPKVTPEQLVEFSGVDTLFLQHMAYQTVAYDDGSFILGDRQGGMILHIDSNGKLIKQIAAKGRGPGEVLDVTMIKRPGGGILVYDQTNKKGLVFDADLKFETEFLIEPFEDAGILNIYDLGEKDKYLFKLSTDSWFVDRDQSREILIASYDKQKGAYSNVRHFQGRSYARFVVANQVVGGTAVPYKSQQIIRYRPEKQKFWMLWTASGQIAELNTQFDTLRTVKIKLPKEEISSAEVDSLEKNYQKQQWKTVEERLPELKTPIQNMRIDAQNRFWLKLSYRSTFDQWLITDSEGISQKIVQLPKGTMLTHVSKHHLGVRMGPGTFALYEPVE